MSRSNGKNYCLVTSKLMVIGDIYLILNKIVFNLQNIIIVAFFTRPTLFDQHSNRKNSYTTKITDIETNLTCATPKKTINA